VYTAAELLPVIPALWCTRRHPEMRLAWRAMATGMVLHAVGDLLYTYHDQNLHPFPCPAFSDAFYLSSYAAFIAGVIAMTQPATARAWFGVRLDGAIAGLSAGAVAGMLWFGPLLHTDSQPLRVAINMAYPLCDILLVVLLVASLAPQRYRPNWPVGLLMLGVLCFVAGYIVFLNQSAVSSYIPGTPPGWAWLVGLMLVSLSASVRDRRRSGRSHMPARSDIGFNWVPVSAGLASLAVLAVSLFRRDPVTVPLLAVAACLLVVVRMGFTLRDTRRSTQEHYQDARTDYMTGLPNRRAFLERACSEYSSRPGKLGGVLLIDLDGFKEINDTLGHAAGDELLCIVARRFERRLGDRGVLARLGGDEYACACPVQDEQELVEIANELVQTLSNSCAIDGMTVRISASIGVALASPEREPLTELLRRSDIAMYAAKHAQSRVAVYQPQDDPHSRDRLALIDDLRSAVEHQELILYYQPQLDLSTGAVCGLEALVRWDHPTRGLQHPDQFIPLAEQNGFMPALTRAVLAAAIAQGAKLDQAGCQMNMSVNISRYDLIDDSLPSYIDRLLATYQYPAERLTLEITESAVSSEPARAKECVSELRFRGLRISIDDFGVGYSSMSQLLGLTIDELKIDKSFVLNLSTDRRAWAVVRATIELAQALGFTAVAEGVEDSATLNTLRRLGADIGQGYGISRPLTPQQLEDHLVQVEPNLAPGAVQVA
jgi:diguanylate cyclase (GGDEF)-like protein